MSMEKNERVEINLSNGVRVLITNKSDGRNIAMFNDAMRRKVAGKL